MVYQDRPPLSIVLFSASNPDATYLTAGLLRGREAVVGRITLQNIDRPRPAREVVMVLIEGGKLAGGNDVTVWHPELVARDEIRHVDVGITLCVPT